jgi:regulation of enolase protein 1 (concanavalin A-like superfamily)
MASAVEVGLAVSSHEVSRLATATFDGVTVTPMPTADLPPGWRSADVGAVGKAGRASEVGGTFTIAGAGDDIWGASDAFRFAYIQLRGDGAVVSRVATVQNVSSWTKAGVMIRQSLDAGAAHASLFVTPAKGIAFQRRVSAGGVTIGCATAGAAPRFVKLARAGTTITASASIDGRTWTRVGEETLAITGPIWAGLAVSSHDATRLASVTFDQTEVFDAATLPAGWQSEDVGEVGVGGAASAAGTTFTISGGGADIWGRADAFHFAHRTLRGDGELIAHVASVGDTHRWAKAGVMIRHGTSASAPFAMMVMSAASGTAFQYRSASGVSAKSVAGSAAGAPYWVKIRRRGATIRGYQSSDGLTWQRVGTVVLAVDASAEIGLVVTSHDKTALCQAVFDGVAP